jgi:hypothetical protein
MFWCTKIKNNFLKNKNKNYLNIFLNKKIFLTIFTITFSSRLESIYAKSIFPIFLCHLSHQTQWMWPSPICFWPTNLILSGHLFSFSYVCAHFLLFRHPPRCSQILSKQMLSQFCYGFKHQRNNSWFPTFSEL